METKEIAGYDFKEWEAIKEEYRKDCNQLAQLNKPFGTLISELFEKEKINETIFADKTKLGVNMYQRLKHKTSKSDPPRMYTLISVCVGLNLSVSTAQTLLYSLGLDFQKTNEVHYAYTYLLTRCRGKSIGECNEILKGLGIAEKYRLGSHSPK